MRNAQKFIRLVARQPETHSLFVNCQSKNRREFKSHNFLCQHQNWKRKIDSFHARESRLRPQSFPMTFCKKPSCAEFATPTFLLPKMSGILVCIPVIVCCFSQISHMSDLSCQPINGICPLRHVCQHQLTTHSCESSNKAWIFVPQPPPSGLCRPCVCLVVVIGSQQILLRRLF